MKKKRKEVKGTIQLFKNDKLIREYIYKHFEDRRRMLKIWESEEKPNNIDKLELIIKPEKI